MNKNFLVFALTCSLLAGKTSLAGPSEGGSNYQSIDAATAQAYINNYKNSVSNKFAEFYALDLNAITNMVSNGASAMRIYNGLMADGSKVAIMVPVDASNNNITSGTQMPAMSSIGICPPNCDINRSVSVQMMAKATAQAAATNYYNNTNYESYNACLVNPAAVTALKNWGATYIQVCNAINTSTNSRCIIYRGVSASGIASYYIMDPSTMGNHTSM